MMPSRRRLLIATSYIPPTLDLVFNYTGQWTDTLETIEGINYRLLAFTSSGSLILDSRMINKVLMDIWTVAGGGDGEAGGDDLSFEGTWHSSEESGVFLSSMGGTPGIDGGWSQLISHKSPKKLMIINIGTEDSSVTSNGQTLCTSSTGGNREGSEWFALEGYGQGGEGGDGARYYGPSANFAEEYVEAQPGGAGDPGIVYIRIPIESQ